MKTVQDNVKSLMAASIIPHQNADFSTKAQVKAWVYGGAIPKSVLNYEPLIDEINKEIKKLSKTAGNKYVYR